MIDLNDLANSLATKSVSKEKLGEAIKLLSQSINHITSHPAIERGAELQQMMHGLVLVIAMGSFQHGRRVTQEPGTSACICGECGE